MPRSNIRLGRRGLLKTCAAVAAVSIVPRHVLGQGQTPPSEKITLAAVGAGGQAGGDIRELDKAGTKLIAFADVDSRRATQSVELFPDAKRFQDYREMLEQVHEQVDAVLVGTPDHTHAVAATAAIKRRKHVYCEKPLAHSVWEVRELIRAAKEAGVVTQLGNQGHSFESVRVFKEWMLDGALGEVNLVHAGCRSSNSRIDQLPLLAEKHEVPPELNWDLWLGPAAFRPYSPLYVPSRWRSWRAFGTGTIGDWTCHVIDPIFWAFDLGAPASVQCNAEDWDPEKHSETFPRGSVLTFRFPAKAGRGPVTVKWFDGTTPIPRPDDLEEGRRMVETGAVVYGEKGCLMYGSHGASSPRILPETKMKAYKLPEKTIPRAPRNSHHQDFVNAIREKRKAGSDFSYGGPLTEIALLGAISQLFPGKELKWDGQRFTNEAAANKHLKPTFREGWSL
jgi:predicted dehydrogenase